MTNTRDVVLSLEDNQRMYRENEESWNELRQKDMMFDVGVMFLDTVQMSGGLYQATAIDKRDPRCAFGYVQYVEMNTFANSIMVMDSYVRPHCRRMGIRTWIQEHLLKQFPMIVSISASPDGKAWMQANNYTYDPAYGWWVCRRLV